MMFVLHVPCNTVWTPYSGCAREQSNLLLNRSAAAFAWCIVVHGVHIVAAVTAAATAVTLLLLLCWCHRVQSGAVVAAALLHLPAAA
jgi:hypothetical protein